MNPPQKMTARLADKQVFNDVFTQYRFELDHPNELHFQAGQYVSVVVDHTGDRRSYSICSNPDNAQSFDLLIDHSPNGVGSNYMRSLQFGNQIDILGPMGRFVVNKQGTEDEIIFVATGSGIAPFRAMVLDLLQDKAEKRPVTLYWGLRYITDLFWANEFQDLVESYSNFKFHPVISKAIEEWTLCRGRVTDCLNIHEIPVNAGYYLCGSAPMIKDTQALLLQKGVSEQNIHFEKFF